METLIQYLDECKDENEARAELDALSLQVDYRGGRLLPPSPVKPHWRVQAFFENAPDTGWLPDGCRRVLVLPSLRRTLLGDSSGLVA